MTWLDAIQLGGPVMYAILGVWFIVLAGVIDRALFAIGWMARRPGHRALRLMAAGRVDEARALASATIEGAGRGIDRIDQTSQLATSIGLFGTVLGIAQGFYARGAAAEGLGSLAEGLSTALFTTIGGLVVFLFGQGSLLLYREWLDGAERRLMSALEGAD